MISQEILVNTGQISIKSVLSTISDDKSEEDMLFPETSVAAPYSRRYASPEDEYYNFGWPTEALLQHHFRPKFQRIKLKPENLMGRLLPWHYLSTFMLPRGWTCPNLVFSLGFGLLVGQHKIPLNTFFLIIIFFVHFTFSFPLCLLTHSCLGWATDGREDGGASSFYFIDSASAASLLTEQPLNHIHSMLHPCHTHCEVCILRVAVIDLYFLWLLSKSRFFVLPCAVCH